MTPMKKLAIVIAVQLFVLLSVIGFKQYTVWTGETVLLKVQPIDPRDPIRGDYITVRYEISDIDTGDIAGDDYVYGTAYIELREDADGYWSAVAIHEDRDRMFDDTLLIKGKVNDGFVRGGPSDLRIDFGIEEIFIPEGSGGQLPFGRDHTIAVEVKIDRFGNAVARGFYVDGEPFELERR